MNAVLGVDPGGSGAIAAYYEDLGTVRVFDTPTAKAGPNNRSVIVDTLFARHVKTLLPLSHAVIEEVHSRPTDGSSSAFKFGVSFGVIRGIIATHEIPTTFVSPSKWKARIGLTGKDKDASRLKAIELFPRQATLFELKKHHGRAEAALLAWAYTKGVLH